MMVSTSRCQSRLISIVPHLTKLPQRLWTARRFEVIPHNKQLRVHDGGCPQYQNSHELQGQRAIKVQLWILVLAL